MITIKTTLKTYGKETTLWYHQFQGQSFEVYYDAKEGYLVRRPDIESGKLYLVKHKHADWVEEESPDNDMV